MFSNYDFTRALVVDHQRQLHHDAHRHHVGILARRAQRAAARSGADDVIARVHYLPAREARTDAGDARAAS